MKKYTVVIPVGASALITVEANSKEEAIKKAFMDSFPPSVCHYCSNEIEIGEFYNEELAEAYEIEEQ